MPNVNFASPAVKLSQNGTEMGPDIMAFVHGVSVEDEINTPTTFTITLGMQDTSTGDWRGVDMSSFVPGDEIKVEMGLDSPVHMVTGEIVSIEPHFEHPTIVELHGFDKMHRLRFGTYRRSFQQIKDSDIASQFASEAGMSADATDTGTTFPYLFQNNLSNYEFLLLRAQRIDYELAEIEGKLSFKPSNESSGEVATLEYGIDLVKFRAKLAALPKGGEVEVRGWDVTQKAEITATAASGSEQSLMGGSKSGFAWSESFGSLADSIVDQCIIDAQDAEKQAKALYNRQLKQFIKGKGEVGGNPLLRRGKTVALAGIGDRFSGTYYIVGSRHEYRVEEGYITKFSVRRTGI